MPGKVKVKIISGRNLPVMDRSSDTTDAYVEIKLGSTTYKTDVCRKSLHPNWNSEWYRFEVDDSELQDEPLQIRLMDHDTYSANDAIGKVYLDLNPLLLPSASSLIRYGDLNNDHPSNSVMSGWIPVYDTMHGIRGEVNVIVKVELFSDFNRFRQSSCGIQFFCSKSIPQGFFAQTIHGFVEELIVNDDPEYQWIDKIRTPRASNEARQTLFFKLSGELQRKIGVKALDLGGNAVIGYCQCFDLEGEPGIVARGIGTAVTLVKLVDIPHISDILNEERAQDYLNFLGFQAGFRLNPPCWNLPIFPCEKKPNSPPLPIIDIDHPRYKKISKALSCEFSQQLRSTKSKSNPSLHEHHPCVKTLLKQEDMRGTPRHGFSQKIKNFKYSSQNMLSKKMIALKARLGDGIGEELDQEDTWRRPRLFKRAVSDSSVMAELLARSVIHAHNSLSCILEVHDSISSGEELHDLEPPEKTVSEPVLSGDDLIETRSFPSSSSSSSDSLNSEEDDKSESEFNYDTVSNVVKNVKMLEKGSFKNFSKQISLPAMSFGEDEEDSSSADVTGVDESDHYLEKVAPIAQIESDFSEDDKSLKHRKSLLPPAQVETNMSENGLVQTAVQTILLDKANLIASYSPPDTPKLEPHDTVLGSRFSSPAILKRQYSVHGSFQSDSELDKAALKSQRKLSFLRFFQSRESGFLRKYKSSEELKKKFSFLRGKKKEKDTVEKHGLLGTALGNVVMETVQDILATSNADKKTKPPPSPVINHVPSVCDNKASQSHRGVCSNNNMHASLTPCLRSNNSPILEHAEPGHHRAESIGTKLVQSPAKLNNIPCIYRRSSDSDLSITPKGNSLTGSDRSNFGMNNRTAILRTTVPQDNFDMLEYPFLTMTKYPRGFISHLGGAVSARSVKLLERISNFEEPESRDIWWSEIRMEIRSHARALNCNAVLAYSETTSICEEVCILSASGTAAVIGFCAGEMSDVIGTLPLIHKQHKETLSTSVERGDQLKNQEHRGKVESPDHENLPPVSSCTICHLPYNKNNLALRATVLKCASCRSGKVPDVLIATVEIPDGAPLIGRGCFIQSYVSRPLRDLKGEINAKEISDGLPFLEYELHRLLVNKLKIKGMNAIFGLKIRISVGEKMLAGIATGTAVFLLPLPAPVLPKLVSDRSSDERKLSDLQKLLSETVKKNREIYQLKTEDTQNGRVLSDDDSEEEQNSMDLSLGNKDCCVLEVDDPQDADVVHMLMEECPPNGFHVVNTEFVPGLEELEIVKNLQMFTQIYRAKFQPPYNFRVHFHRLLQSVYFKLRRMVPCALCDLQFRIDLPETDEVQLCVLGMALGLGDPQKNKPKKKNLTVRKPEDDLIFNLEEVNIPENTISGPINNHNRIRPKSPSRNRIQTNKQRHMPYKERHGVDITPLSYVPGGKIEHYLGNLNFFFIRETTSIREEGGLSGFIHSFVTEVLAIVRAHVTALGGNAMVAYFMTECVLNHNLHKNQGQCLINVGGDVVFVSYFKDEA